MLVQTAPPPPPLLLVLPVEPPAPAEMPEGAWEHAKETRPAAAGSTAAQSQSFGAREGSCMVEAYCPIWNVIWFASAEGRCTELMSGTQSRSRSGVYCPTICPASAHTAGSIE